MTSFVEGNVALFFSGRGGGIKYKWEGGCIAITVDQEEWLTNVRGVNWNWNSPHLTFLTNQFSFLTQKENIPVQSWKGNKPQVYIGNAFVYWILYTGNAFLVGYNVPHVEDMMNFV